MEKLIRHLLNCNGKRGTAIVEHIAFDRHIIQCENIHVFCANDKIGLTIMNKDIYILLKDISSFDYNNNECIISTKIKSIKIKIANF